jgi:hypothetical protein
MYEATGRAAEEPDSLLAMMAGQSRLAWSKPLSDTGSCISSSWAGAGGWHFPSFDIPLACVRSAAAGAPHLPKFRWTDLRLGGTSVPGTLAAGRFWIGSSHRWMFLDLRRSSKESRFRTAELSL